MRRILFLLPVLSTLLFPLAVKAQQPVPVAQNPPPAGVTIITSNVFQQALPSKRRNGCAIQYTGTNTGFVYFGLITQATTPTSIQLTAKQSVSCASTDTLVAVDAISVTGTVGDTFVVLQQ
jgi:hypothetical protein